MGQKLPLIVLVCTTNIDRWNHRKLYVPLYNNITNEPGKRDKKIFIFYFIILYFQINITGITNIATPIIKAYEILLTFVEIRKTMFISSHRITNLTALKIIR